MLYALLLLLWLLLDVDSPLSVFVFAKITSACAAVRMILNENRDSKLSGECGEGLECKPTDECFVFNKEEPNLEVLTVLSQEWPNFVAKLKALKFNGQHNWVYLQSKGVWWLAKGLITVEVIFRKYQNASLCNVIGVNCVGFVLSRFSNHLHQKPISHGLSVLIGFDCWGSWPSGSQTERVCGGRRTWGTALLSSERRGTNRTLISLNVPGWEFSALEKIWGYWVFLQARWWVLSSKFWNFILFLVWAKILETIYAFQVY